MSMGVEKSSRSDPFKAAVAVLHSAVEADARVKAGDRALAPSTLEMYAEGLRLLDQALTSGGYPEQVLGLLRQKASEVRGRLGALEPIAVKASAAAAALQEGVPPSGANSILGQPTDASFLEQERQAAAAAESIVVDPVASIERLEADAAAREAQVGEMKAALEADAAAHEAQIGEMKAALQAAEERERRALEAAIGHATQQTAKQKEHEQELMVEHARSAKEVFAQIAATDTAKAEMQSVIDALNADLRSRSEAHAAALADLAGSHGESSSQLELAAAHRASQLETQLASVRKELADEQASSSAAHASFGAALAAAQDEHDAEMQALREEHTVTVERVLGEMNDERVEELERLVDSAREDAVKDLTARLDADLAAAVSGEVKPFPEPAPAPEGLQKVTQPAAIASAEPVHYRALLPCIIRRSAAKDSEKTGELAKGEIVQAISTEEVDGTTRVQFDQGWMSVAAATGTVLLEALSQETVEYDPPIEFKVLSSCTVRMGPDKIDKKLGEYKKEAVLAVIQERTNSNGITSYWTTTAGKGLPSGGWVKLNDSKGKVLLERKELKPSAAEPELAEPTSTAVPLSSGQPVCSGTLRVEVIACSNLLPADANGKADPFVSIALEHSVEKTAKTKTVSKTLNPVFKQTLELHVDLAVDSDSSHSWELEMQAWDRDRGSKPDFLGEAVLDLSAEEVFGSAGWAGGGGGESVRKILLGEERAEATGFSSTLSSSTTKELKRRLAQGSSEPYGTVHLKLSFEPSDHEAQMRERVHEISEPTDASFLDLERQAAADESIVVDPVATQQSSQDDSGIVRIGGSDGEIGSSSDEDHCGPISLSADHVGGQLAMAAQVAAAAQLVASSDFDLSIGLVSAPLSIQPEPEPEPEPEQPESDEWYYQGNSGETRGPEPLSNMQSWREHEYLPAGTLVRNGLQGAFRDVQEHDVICKTETKPEHIMSPKSSRLDSIHAAHVVAIGKALVAAKEEVSIWTAQHFQGLTDQKMEVLAERCAADLEAQRQGNTELLQQCAHDMDALRAQSQKVTDQLKVEHTEAFEATTQQCAEDMDALRVQSQRVVDGLKAEHSAALGEHTAAMGEALEKADQSEAMAEAVEAATQQCAKDMDALRVQSQKVVDGLKAEHTAALTDAMGGLKQLQVEHTDALSGAVTEAESQKVIDQLKAEHSAAISAAEQAILQSCEEDFQEERAGLEKEKLRTEEERGEMEQQVKLLQEQQTAQTALLSEQRAAQVAALEAMHRTAVAVAEGAIIESTDADFEAEREEQQQILEFQQKKHDIEVTMLQRKHREAIRCCEEAIATCKTAEQGEAVIAGGYTDQIQEMEERMLDAIGKEELAKQALHQERVQTRETLDAMDASWSRRQRDTESTHAEDLSERALEARRVAFEAGEVERGKMEARLQEQNTATIMSCEEAIAACKAQEERKDDELKSANSQLAEAKADARAEQLDSKRKLMEAASAAEIEKVELGLALLNERNLRAYTEGLLAEEQQARAALLEKDVVFMEALGETQGLELLDPEVRRAAIAISKHMLFGGLLLTDDVASVLQAWDSEINEVMDMRVENEQLKGELSRLAEYGDGHGIMSPRASEAADTGDSDGGTDLTDEDSLAELAGELSLDTDADGEVLPAGAREHVVWNKEQQVRLLVNLRDVTIISDDGTQLCVAYTQIKSWSATGEQVVFVLRDGDELPLMTQSSAEAAAISDQLSEASRQAAQSELPQGEDSMDLDGMMAELDMGLAGSVKSAQAAGETDETWPDV